MTKKWIILLFTACLVMSGCGTTRAEYDALKDKYEKYLEASKAAEQKQWENDSEYDETVEQDQWDDNFETDADFTEDTPETPEISIDLQTFNYIASMDGNTDFNITYNNDVLTVLDYYDTPAVYFWANKDLEYPRAFLHVRYGNWEDHYNNPVSRYVLERGVTEISEASPLSVNGYDGYCWTVHKEDSAINWNNDIYIYTIQLDPEHYFYVETSRIDLTDCCTYEEFLTYLIHNIEF